MFSRFKEDTTQLKDIGELLKGRVNGKVIKHEVSPLTSVGENFGSEILRVEITTEENGQQKILHAVAKLIPPTEMQLAIFNTQVTFKNEAAFLKDITLELQDFQREHHFPEIADYFPELYGARFNLKSGSDVVDEDAVILMENLKLNGYGNIDRSDGFDLDSAKKIIKVLANLQSTAVALKLKKPDVFASKIRPYLTEFKMPVFGDSSNDPLFSHIEPYLKEHPSTASSIPKIRKYFANMRAKRSRKFREPWATIVHNDLWVNNIMVKHTNEAVSGVKLVDFQVIEYGSPINDLIFFLITSVQGPVLRYHFDKLLLFYYNEFIKTLKQCNVDLKEFSYESFQEELKLAIPDEMYHSLFMLNVVFGPKGMPKIPGKVAEWNPSGKSNPLSNGNSSIPNHGGPPGPGGPSGFGGPGNHGGPSSHVGPGNHGGPGSHDGPSNDGGPGNHGGPGSHVGPGDHGGPKGPTGPGGSGGPGGPRGPEVKEKMEPPTFVWPAACKEKLWFIMEKAIKQNWI